MNNQNLLATQTNNQKSELKTIGNYTFNNRHCLGEGSFGKVFEGFDQINKRLVAIKKLDKLMLQYDTYLQQSINQEIEILKHFNHPNIVKFIDMIPTKKSLYIITEFCKDGDLSKVLRKRQLPEEQVLKIMKQIIEGFKELVRQNVIHRDLKPANILNHDNVFKIADFGFAKFVDFEGHQMLKSRVGTPLYMSPQLLQKKQYSTKSDVWSLGIMYYEMLCGDVPWIGRNEIDLTIKVLNMPLLFKGGQLSQFSQTLIARMLKIEEKERIGWDELFQQFESDQFREAANEKLKFQYLDQLQAGKNLQYKGASSLIDKKQNNQNNNNNIINNNNQLNEPHNLFTELNQQREDLVLKHYLCSEMILNYDPCINLLKSEVDYEKLILLFSTSVLLISEKLYQDIMQKEQEHKNWFYEIKKLRAIVNSVQKEHDFYKKIVDDITEIIRRKGQLNNLKCDQDLAFLFQKDLSYQDNLKIQMYLKKIKVNFIKEVLQSIKDKLSQEQARSILQLLDFLIDILIRQHKSINIKDVDFNALYETKNDNSDINTYYEKISTKFTQIQFI